LNQVRNTAAVIAAILALSPSIGAQSPTTPDTSRGLTIRFADGRMHTKPLRPKGGIWTAVFPRVPGATPTHEGLPLSVIDIRHVVDGAHVVVTVSLSYGGANKNQVKVAAVRLSPGATVEVTELRNHGVEPITLSIVSIPSTAAEPVEVVSPSPMLDLRAEQNGPNASSYRVTLMNRSDLPLMWVHFEGYRGGKRFSGGQGGDWNQPLVAPRSQHAFEIAIGPSGFIPGDSPEAWSAIDRLEITSLMWQDGRVEGARANAVSRSRSYERRAGELRTLIAILDDHSWESPATLRTRLATVTSSDAEIRFYLGILTADLDKLSESGRARDLPFEQWLPSMAKFVRDWLNRIVLPKVAADSR
jgi:hypothetical protein